LRRLFEDEPKQPRVIETIPNAGYRLIAPVEALSRQGEVTSPTRPTSETHRRGTGNSGMINLKRGHRVVEFVPKYYF